MTIKIFESKYYASVMYILIMITIIAITFNFVNITNKININQTIHETKLTGYAVSQNQNTNTQINNTNISQSEKKELYSEKSYAIYYLTLMGLLILIFIVLVTFIMPKIKHLT